MLNRVGKHTVSWSEIRVKCGSMSSYDINSYPVCKVTVKNKVSLVTLWLSNCCKQPRAYPIYVFNNNGTKTEMQFVVGILLKEL